LGVRTCSDTRSDGGIIGRCWATLMRSLAFRGWAGSLYTSPRCLRSTAACTYSSISAKGPRHYLPAYQTSHIVAQQHVNKTDGNCDEENSTKFPNQYLSVECAIPTSGGNNSSLLELVQVLLVWGRHVPVTIDR